MLSRAKADIVVREPQNPVAINSEYLGSKFQLTDKIENTPRIKLPQLEVRRWLKLLFVRLDLMKDALEPEIQITR